MRPRAYSSPSAPGQRNARAHFQGAAREKSVDRLRHGSVLADTCRVATIVTLLVDESVPLSKVSCGEIWSDSWQEEALKFTHCAAGADAVAQEGAVLKIWLGAGAAVRAAAGTIS